MPILLQSHCNKNKSSRLKRHRRFIYLFLALHIAAGSEEFQLIIQCNRSARYCLFYALILMHYLARQDCKTCPILLYFKWLHSVFYISRHIHNSGCLSSVPLKAKTAYPLLSVNEIKAKLFKVLEDYWTLRLLFA